MASPINPTALFGINRLSFLSAGCQASKVQGAVGDEGFSVAAVSSLVKYPNKEIVMGKTKWVDYKEIKSKLSQEAILER